MMSVQLLGTGGVAVLLLIAVAAETAAIVDVALLLALLAALAAVTFVTNASGSDAAGLPGGMTISGRGSQRSYFR
jgi:multicomponent Na+:H+ antiporter subunit F